MPARPGRHRGVALVTMLLVTALVMVLVSAMLSDTHLLIRRSQGTLARAVALQIALGGEEVARQVLHDDYLADHEQGQGKDHLAEPWAAEGLPFEFAEGDVYIRIIDLQSFINVNNLLGATSKATLGRLRRLFALLSLDPALVARIKDWLDADQTVTEAGAEDADYLLAAPPYRAANGMIADISELRLVAGIDAATYDAVAPYLVALPAAAVPINLNTAPNPVLEALGSGLDETQAASLEGEREARAGFDRVADAAQVVPALTGTPAVSVNSAFFQVQIRVRLADVEQHLFSILHRDPSTGVLRVIARDLGRHLIVTEEGSLVL